MLFIVLTMLVIVALALLVATYVAYPRRGADVPALPWIGDALGRGVDALPTLREERLHQVQ